MDKVYLKYDDNRPCVECDYGFAKEMLLLGFIYPLKKGDLRFSLIIFLLQLSICILLIVLFNIPILSKLILCIIMLVIINLLFASNHNLLEIERLFQ